MSDHDQLTILAQGPVVWNEWRSHHPDAAVDLSNMTICDPFPEFAYLEPARIELAGVDLAGANLRHSVLRWANLSGANLRGADLVGADCRACRFCAADMTETKLMSTNLTLASLRDADLTRALLWETVLARTELRDTKGLDTCRHGGPSVLDHRTIRKSPNVPRVFWQGCGVPDALLDYMLKLTARQSSMPSCFISYSTNDSQFVTKLYADLQKNRVDCWMAEHNLKGGRYLLEQIEEAIADQQRVLLILSEHSIASNWVAAEILRARSRERADGRQVLFPIRLVDFRDLQQWTLFDSDSGEDLAKIVRSYYVPDFSPWRDKAQYAEALGRLLQDLRDTQEKRKPQHNKAIEATLDSAPHGCRWTEKPKS